MYIRQKQLDNLSKIVSAGKVIVIYGPRRCGKTTLIKEYLKNSAIQQPLLVSGEDITVHDYLSSRSIEKLKSFVGKARLLVIDEAQKIRAIGENLKLIVDHIPDISIIATGSSSFDLSRHVGEPLTGRKFTLRLFPLAQLELAQLETQVQTDANLESRLIHGSYPEVILAEDNTIREMYLKELVGAYLYKDILELEGIRQSHKIGRLLQLLAFQLGKEVSFTELGTQLGMSKNTIEKYLDLLEKAFVLIRLNGFSRNLRTEISKNPRYYFLDNGIRNALINNFNPLSVRDDIGMLWENYLVIERLKWQEYLLVSGNRYFWRTYDRKEIDLVEERAGRLNGYELKWTAGHRRVPKTWTAAYPGASFEVISRENYLGFIAGSISQ